ncbi:MAG: hypothetical protein AB7T32_14310 [Dehalococcoidia bacterium]
MTLDRYAPETRISTELVKRAIDDAHIASASITEVYGPILESLEHKGAAATLPEVHEMMHEWLTLWQEVRRICDAYMKRNRTYFRLRPHAELSDILLNFENRMVDIYDEDSQDVPHILSEIRKVCGQLDEELAGYYDWAREACEILELSFEENDAKSAQRAERFWQPNIRAMEKMMQEG